MLSLRSGDAPFAKGFGGQGNQPDYGKYFDGHDGSVDLHDRINFTGRPPSLRQWKSCPSFQFSVNGQFAQASFDGSPEAHRFRQLLRELFFRVDQ